MWHTHEHTHTHTLTSILSISLFKVDYSFSTSIDKHNSGIFGRKSAIIPFLPEFPISRHIDSLHIYDWRVISNGDSTSNESNEPDAVKWSVIFFSLVYITSLRLHLTFGDMELIGNCSYCICRKADGFEFIRWYNNPYKALPRIMSTRIFNENSIDEQLILAATFTINEKTFL